MTTSINHLHRNWLLAVTVMRRAVQAPAQHRDTGRRAG